MNKIQKYLDNIIKEYNTGRAREHSYRPALKDLLEDINLNILATNEPAREKCWAPDFIITDKKNIPRWYIEAKNIIANILDDKKNQAQIQKYFDWELWYNFIHTDNLEFRFYKNAELVDKVIIWKLENNKIIALTENFDKLEDLIKNFLTFKTQTITSSKKLSEIMAWKARMIKRVIYMALKNNKDIKTEIHNQFEIFKKMLISDLDEESFADIYAQTITYWLFTARLHDPTLPTFDRDEAAMLLPKSNPFLKKFFQSLRDDLDPRIEWIVDDLVEIFLACDVKKLLEWYWKTSARNDPIIHFYEDFLANYDKKLRKSKWVYYTPVPVVDFIIKWVDYILKTEFDLSDWLADTSKIEIELDSQEVNKRTGKLKKYKKQVHKVQILDPATGTGTFLNDIVKFIYENNFAGMSGIWKSYVDENLLPRLHWFEIMMASYAMAHLKLDLTLRETGYENKSQERLWIYLTNSLEEHHEDTWTLFATFLSNESTEASFIKKNMPIMTIVWNPPYAVSSQNKWKWILDLLQDYKKDLNERKINLDDDYIKFIRYGEQYIEKNGEWILAYISNNSYLDWITHRQMRKHLLETFDKIYIYDLHWNARKKETCPDGSIDQNVFDIMAWVNIIFAIKTQKKKKQELAEVFHYDSYWKRQEKYDKLNNSNFQDINWKKLNYQEPYYFFVPKDFSAMKKYEEGFSVEEIFWINSNWIETGKDWLIVSSNIDYLNKLKKYFIEKNESELIKIYNVKIDKIRQVKNDINNSKIIKFYYRPFDIKYTFYSKNSQWVLWRPRHNINKHFFSKNLWLLLKRQTKKDFSYVFCIDKIWESCIFESAYAKTQIFPLYLYQENLLEWKEEKIANFNMETIWKIEEKLGMKFEDPLAPKGGSCGRSWYDKPWYVTAEMYSYKYIKETRDELKNNMTEAEIVVWEELKTKKLGYKFRRQHIIDTFIVDFVCLDKKLIVEIDWKIHEKQKEKDFYRTEKLNEIWFKVIRFKNEEVFSNLQSVIEKIKKELSTNIPPLGVRGSSPTELFSSEDLFDYIYGVLHSKSYREKFKEFLKIDFPKIPFDVDKETFFKLRDLWKELRSYHLMENPILVPKNFITNYPVDGENEVEKIKYKDWKVFINDEQYFEWVPENVWEFYIWWYQPAQKWLKDRKWRKLNYEDIIHYSKIILVLKKTIEIMDEIENIFNI